MICPEFFFESLQWRHTPGCNASETAFDSLDRFQFIDPFHESLVRYSVLYDELGLPVDREHNRVTAGAHLLQELAGVALEVAQRTNVFHNIEHGSVLCIKYALNLMLTPLSCRRSNEGSLHRSPPRFSPLRLVLLVFPMRLCVSPETAPQPIDFVGSAFASFSSFERRRQRARELGGE